MSVRDSQILYVAAILITLSIVGLIVAAVVSFSTDDKPDTKTVKTCVTLSTQPLTVRCTTIPF